MSRPTFYNTSFPERIRFINQPDPEGALGGNLLRVQLSSCDTDETTLSPDFLLVI